MKKMYIQCIFGRASRSEQKMRSRFRFLCKGLSWKDVRSQREGRLSNADWRVHMRTSVPFVAKLQNYIDKT